MDYTKKLLLLILFITSGVGVYAQKKILIYTHNGKGYKHENIPASVEAIGKLCSENGYRPEATDDPAVFTPEKLAGYACIVFSNSNNEAFDTEAQKSAFTEYIHKGGAFVGVHSASGSERQWDWFAAMLGGRFVRHPALQKFTIKVIDHANPSTKFLGDTWAWEDECYYTNNINPDIHVLLAADLSTITDEKMSEYPGKTFGNYFPLAWCHEFEGGRQFYTALGHKPEYYKDPNFLKHLLGGIQWALKER